MKAAGLEYAEAGEGAPVLCLHGLGGGVESFRPQLDGLAGPGIRVLSVAMPGFGASEPLPGPPSFEGLGAAVGRFVDALGLGAVHLAGHSVGGMVALDHALRRPEQVATLALIGTTSAFGGRDDAFRDAFLRARLAPLDAGGDMAALAADSAGALVGPGAAPEAVAAVEAIMARVPESTWRGMLGCLVAFDRRGDLGRVAQPCCLVAGGHDANAPPRTMERMAARLPRAEYRLVEEAGHMINQEAPGAVNAILRDFVRRHA